MAYAHKGALSLEDHPLFHGFHVALESLPLHIRHRALLLLTGEILDFLQIGAQVLHYVFKMMIEILS